MGYVEIRRCGANPFHPRRGTHYVHTTPPTRPLIPATPLSTSIPNSGIPVRGVYWPGTLIGAGTRMRGTNVPKRAAAPILSPTEKSAISERSDKDEGD